MTRNHFCQSKVARTHTDFAKIGEAEGGTLHFGDVEEWASKNSGTKTPTIVISAILYAGRLIGSQCAR